MSLCPSEFQNRASAPFAGLRTTKRGSLTRAESDAPPFLAHVDLLLPCDAAAFGAQRCGPGTKHLKFLVRRWERLCALRIQAVFRGHRGRQIYRVRRQLSRGVLRSVTLDREQEDDVRQQPEVPGLARIPASIVVPTQHLVETVGPRDPARRRAFFERRVGSLTLRLVEAIDAEVRRASGAS